MDLAPLFCDLQTLDTDDILVVKICLKHNLLSMEQLQEILSQNIGRQLIFIFSEILNDDKLNELFRLKKKWILCPKCETLNRRPKEKNSLFCCECNAFIRINDTNRVTTTSLRRKYGRYRIIEKVGEGSAGIVYRALQVDLERTVALKVLKPEMLDANAISRFKQEAKSVACLNNPYIVSLYDIGEDHGEYYISMEYVPGKKLTKYIRSKKLTIQESLQICIKLAEGLEHAHQNKIIHRDIKPDNILISASKMPKLTDFGLARQLTNGMRLTQGNVIMGTPIYMSPEQARGDLNVAYGTDIYSLGVVLYEMLSGTPPFEETTTLTLLNRVVYEAPPALRKINPGISVILENICMKAIAKKPEDRFKSMKDFREELEKFACFEREKEVIAKSELNKLQKADTTEPVCSKEYRPDTTTNPGSPTNEIPLRKKPTMRELMSEAEEQQQWEIVDLVLWALLSIGLLYMCLRIL